MSGTSPFVTDRSWPRRISPVEIVLYGYFGKGNLGDEALLGVWSRVLSDVGETVPMAPPRLPRKGTVVFTGEPLQDRTSRRSLFFYAAAIRAAAGRGRAVLGAVGVDVRSVPGRRLLPKILRDVDYISVRDPLSLRQLHAVGVTAREARDVALLLDPPGGSRRGPVLLNLVPTLPASVRRSALAFAREAARRLGKRVKALVMARKEDERALRGLDPVLAGSADEALEAIADAALVVGARLHSLEFSLLCGTPFVAVPYAPKVEAFLDLVGRDLPAPVPRIPGARAREALESILSVRYRVALSAARTRLRREATEGVTDVVRYLRRVA